MVEEQSPNSPPTLVVIKGENEGETFDVRPHTQIGREQDNDVILIDPKISRYHAQINLDGEQWVIKDLGSSNGTYVNGHRIGQGTVLRTSDRVSIGETDFTFTLPQSHREDTLAMPRTTAPPPRTPGAQPIPPQSQKRSTSPLVWGAAAFILLLCTVAVIAIFFISRGSDNDGPVAEGTTEAIQTDEAGNDTEAITPIEGDDTPAPPPAAENLVLVYEDNFSDPFGGWDDAFDTYTTKQYGNNRYQIEVSTNGLVAWGLANRDVGDFEMEVEARLEDDAIDNSYGLMFRLQDLNNYYRFDVSNEGFYLFSKFDEGEWLTLIDWTASPYINSDETNLLKVSALGPNITLWANGQQLDSLTDESFTHGNFGFFAGTFEQSNIWVSFDNIKVWVPEGQQVTLIPTAAAATPQPETTPTQTASPTATPTQAAIAAVTEEAEEEDEAAEETPTATPTVTPTSEPSPTATPLPNYISRDQPLARGEEEIGGQIIFPVFDPSRGTYDVYVADAADGANRTLIQEEASQPTFNNDGSEIAYRSWRADQRGLYARPLSGGDPWGFDLFFESARPQFSPIDNSLMYYSRTGGGDAALYRVIDGLGQVMRHSEAPVQGQGPKWSPDGQQVIYNTCLGGKCGVVLNNILNSAPILLTDQPSDSNPEISPDGETVVFMSRRSGSWKIYSVGIDGENLTALTGDEVSGLPTWSPDGQYIAFVTNREGAWEIWRMDADGDNPTQLFALDGSIDGSVSVDVANSQGWTEENIDWTE
ncbi:MAG: FHA domain-containing protein [Chloroflexota bacterium]